MAILDNVKCIKSIDSNAVPIKATVPFVVTRYRNQKKSGTSNTPAKALTNRQPNGVTPNSLSPMAISIFPMGGCVISYIGIPCKNS